ncbi:MAG TPA: DedA family protein/thiosulfate sulfurtransferase GlpE [Rubrivivax sp.]|nr:DedA family protein/thiosulfate sulfurtransferase GlpE [Rubrivivax sp.]
MSQLIALVVAHGALFVFGAALAARAGAPVPAAPVLVVAGGLATSGQLSWAAALAAAIAGSLIGDGLWFWAGRAYGYRVLRLLCRISLSPDSCVRQGETFFQRWGGSSLIAAKFVPGVSAVAPPMAGAFGMSWFAFLGYGLLAAAIWAVLFLGLGWIFAEQIRQVIDMLSALGALAVAALAAVVAAYLALRWWRRRLFLRGIAAPRITASELRRLIDGGTQPAIVDVRSGAALALDPRRIPGAVAVELADIEGLARELPRERELVLYCNCPNEASAAMAAGRLRAQGFRRVRPLSGGLDAWVEAGHETELHPGDTAAALQLPEHAAARRTVVLPPQ